MEFGGVSENTTSSSDEEVDDDYDDYTFIYRNNSPFANTLFQLEAKLILQEHTISHIGVVISLASFVLVVATCALLPKWRLQERNKVFVHLIVVSVHHTVYYVDGYDALKNVLIFVFGHRIYGIAYAVCEIIYTFNAYLVCVWVLLFIIYMRETLVRVLVTEDIFKTYVYYLAYTLPLPYSLFVYCYGAMSFTEYHFIFVAPMYCTLFISIIIYGLTIKTVLGYFREGSACRRNKARVILKFVLLYTLITIQTILQLISYFTDYILYTQSDAPYTQLTLYSLYVYYYAQSLSHIPTSICVLYCLFGNKTTREMWTYRLNSFKTHLFD